MKEAVRQTRSYLMDLFKRHGFNPRTDLGQNFLIDLNIVEYIVQHAHINQHDVVLEVGAGTGGMTTFLAQNAAHVVSVELDSNMYGLAFEATESFSNVTLLNVDVLERKNRISPLVLHEVEQELAKSPKRKLKLVSNLPYNIATPLVSNLVATELDWERMVITIQLELGQRMVAVPRNSHYGSLSVWLQSQCYVKLLKRLKPNAFWPRPKVNSAIMRLVPNSRGKQDILNRSFFLDFLRRLFHLRRKYLRSVVVGMYRKQLDKPQLDGILQQCELPEGIRAEQLEVAQLVNLSNQIYRSLPETTE